MELWSLCLRCWARSQRYQAPRDTIRIAIVMSSHLMMTITMAAVIRKAMSKDDLSVD